MRTTKALLVGVLLASTLTSCGKSEDKAHRDLASSAGGEGQSGAAPAANVAVNANVAAKAQMGGQLLAIGKNAVELRLFANGSADALVYDETGALVADPSKAKVVIHANAAANAHPTIELGFAVPTGRLSGAAASKVDLVPGPIDVDLSLGALSATGRLEAPILLVGPTLGGTLAVAGKYGVELLARVDGTVEAVVHDAAGALVTGDAGAKVDLKLTGVDGQAHSLALAFDASKACFVGKADAAWKLAAGPAEIAINGQASARLPQLALRAEATHGGKVLVAGDYSAELVAKGNVVSAFVLDASGAAAANGDLGLAVRVGQGGFVGLAWDAPSASYRATFGTAVDFDLEPITLAVKAGARAFVGACVPSVKVDARAKANAKVDAKAGVDAKAVVDANAKAKLDAKANVKAPTASGNVTIKAPKVTVGTGGGGKAGGSAAAGAGFSFGTK